MSSLDLPNPGAEFGKYFQLVLAVTPELQDQAFRIRHEVYCEELGFEGVSPDGRERDEYDRHSKQLLLRSVSTGIWVGCTRLVLPRPEDPSYPLPIEHVCASTIDRGIVDPAAMPRHSIAEISRLAVVRGFRRRKGEEQSKDGAAQIDYGTSTQPRFPYIQLGLYLGAVALGHRLGMETLFFLTEPRLAGHFQKLGFSTQQIGGPVEHRGTRVPSAGRVNDTIAGLRLMLRPLYKIIEQEVDTGLASEGQT